MSLLWPDFLLLMPSTRPLLRVAGRSSAPGGKTGKIRDPSSPLDFRSYAAAVSQARWMAWISPGVGWSGRYGLNLAAMRTRRSLAVMSDVDGWVLVLYQGAAARRSSMSAGSWPAVAYQQAAMAWHASWNGTVRRTAFGVRLRACPAPNSCFASSIATSMLHLAAYRSMTCAGLAFRSVVTRARSYPDADLSRTSTTCTGRVPKTVYHRHVMAAVCTVSVLP